MRPLSASELLGVWERGLVQPPAQWALTLLAVACPDTPAAALGQLSIGERDGRLLTLREWAFGPDLVSLATCPACGDKLEMVFQVADLRARPASETAAAPTELALAIAGYDLRFRLPNGLDVTAVTADSDPVANQHALFQRCLLDIRHDDVAETGDALPDYVIEAVIAHMAEADPQADVQLGLLCPTCSHRWQASFDIVAFFWREINTWAYRILQEVHVLATAYGWREADILALTPWRRQFYLEMVGNRS